MEFKIEISPDKKNPMLVRVDVINKENEFCCEMILDLYKSSYGQFADKSDQTQTFVYGGLNFILSEGSSIIPFEAEKLRVLGDPKGDDGPSVELTFVFEFERKRRLIGLKKEQKYMGYTINYCPFCGEPITVREIQHVLSNETEKVNK